MHEVRHVFTQLVRCVEHLHDRGTLHGDIKVTPFTTSTASHYRLTSNLLLTSCALPPSR
jgi:serine/threonine protein kinase